MRARMETIATWLLKQQTMKRLIQNGKRMSIIMQFQTKASLEVLDQNIHRKLIVARQGIQEQRNMTKTNEKPPDFKGLVHIL